MQWWSMLRNRVAALNRIGFGDLLVHIAWPAFFIFIIANVGRVERDEGA